MSSLCANVYGRADIPNVGHPHAPEFCLIWIEYGVKALPEGEAGAFCASSDEGEDARFPVGACSFAELGIEDPGKARGPQSSPMCNRRRFRRRFCSKRPHFKTGLLDAFQSTNYGYDERNVCFSLRFTAVKTSAIGVLVGWPGRQPPWSASALGVPLLNTASTGCFPPRLYGLKRRHWRSTRFLSVGYVAYKMGLGPSNRVLHPCETEQLALVGLNVGRLPLSVSA